MSNPFLDPLELSPEDVSQNGSPAVVTLSKTNPFYENSLSNPEDSLSKSNPFYDDFLGAPFGENPSVESSNAGSGTLLDSSVPEPTFGLSALDFTGDVKSDEDGLDAADVLLDLGIGPPQASGGTGTPPSNNAMQFDQHHFSIPPPMEFSDSLMGGGNVSVQNSKTAGDSQTPVTNIDDLLGMDFSDASMSGSVPVAVPVTTNGISAKETVGSDDSFDFLLDEGDAREDIEPLADIAQEAPPAVPSEEPPALPTEAPPPVPIEAPPPVPSEAPPPLPFVEPPSVPADTFPDETDVAKEATDAEEKTSLFLPSENPADNVTQVSVTSELSADDCQENKTVHKTDIMVTSPKVPSVTSVNVTAPEAAPRNAATTGDAKSPPGPAVIKFDSGSSSASTQIQFDTSEAQPMANISIPPAAFVVTTLGVTRPPNADLSQEEEEITQMMVHKDHLGNKLATPSPPETLGRQTLEPRKLDESAKRALQSVMVEMTKNERGLPGVSNGVSNEDQSDSVQEDEIVPVKLTRQEAETAERVLKSWMAGDKKTPAATEKPAKKSAFQMAAGTIVDVQTGKTTLPANAVFFTTMGITRNPAPNGVTEEEEEITPMTVHKDHLGNKHYAPSPPETLGKQEGIRILDKAVKQDIVEVMSSMSAMPVQASSFKVVDAKGKKVKEESIVPTLLSREDARTALAVLAKWSSGESAPKPKSTPTSFQRLVVNVLDAGANKDKADHTVHASVVNVVKDRVQSPSSEEAADNKRVGEQEKEETVNASLVVLESKPAKTPPDVKPKPSTPEAKPKAELSEKRSMFEPSEQTSSTAPLQSKPVTSQSDARLKSSTHESKPGPVVSQRGLRAPIKLGLGTAPLSQSSFLNTKPLSRVGGLSVSNRSISLLSAAKTAQADYVKSRTEDAPFLVEVLKGIVGLGIKVAVTPEGHVQITEVQRNSPVDKSGHVQVGDYLVCVNNTELTGLPDGRVQQILRLLPRGLAKLVVSAQPPGQDKGSESASPQSPRPVGAYSQFGVRLSPLPFSPTPSDGQSSSLTSSATPPISELSTAPSAVEPLSVCVDSDDDSDMSTRRLSKALSPRSNSVQTYSPEPPKPVPRQRAANVPTSLSQSSGDGDSDPGQTPPSKAERKMAASDIVAAASRRPSGRNDDLPAPPDTALPLQERMEKSEEQGVLGAASPRSRSVSSASSSSIDPVLEASRHPAGVSSPRDEALPVFVETAKKVAPTPSPRHKARSSSGDEMKDCVDAAPEINGKEDDIVKAEVFIPDEIKPQSAAPIQTASPAAKIPPPVAPKPRRTPSASSDKSASSSHSDDTVKDLPSPTLVSPNLRDFADAHIPSVEEQQSRKRVTSAARMFEKKAEDSVKTVPTQKEPTKSSRSVSSVIKSFNREPEPEPSKQEKVVMRKVSVGVSLGSDSGKPINSALLPPSERRKSMPNPIGSSSFSLTKPSSLVQLRHPPSSRGAVGRKSVEAEDDQPSAVNSALAPRHTAGYLNTTSLKSISALRDSREEKRMSAPPVVGKDTFSKFDKSPSSPTSKHDGTSSHSRYSFTSSLDKSSDDINSPKMIFTSSSLHHADRHRPLSSSAASWKSEDSHDPHLAHTMKKFDDLLSDRHTLDSDDELPKVSNSVSLDLLKSRNASRVAATIKPKEEAAAEAAQSKSQDAEPEHSVDGTAEQAEETPDRKEPLNNEPIENVSGEETTKPEVMETVEMIKAESVSAAPPTVRQKEDVSDKPQQEEEPVHPTKDKQDKMESVQRAVEEKETPLQKLVEDTISKTEIHSTESPPRPEEENVESSVPAEAPIEITEVPVGGEESQEADDDTEQETAHAEKEIDLAAYSEAAELIYQQQASNIVSTIVSRALMEVDMCPQDHPGLSQPQDDYAEEPDERSSTPSPPPIPDEGPPPLPGAPPPPLILRNEVERLVDAADLVGLVPSQDAVFPGGEAVESAEVELEIDDSITAQSVQQNFSTPTKPSRADGDGKTPEPQIINTSDVLIPVHRKPPVLTNLQLSPDPVSVGHVDDDKEDCDMDIQHSDNHPVIDTLSQDSGVQDEDMSEDGLRFSQDDSPTGNDSSSVFDSVTSPEDEVVKVPAVRDSESTKSPVAGQQTDGTVSTDYVTRDFVSVDTQNVENKVGVKTSVHITHSRVPPSVPVMCDVTEPTDTVSRSTSHPHDSVTFTAKGKSLTSTSVIVTHVHDNHSPDLQDSSSPKCSSPRQEEAEEFPGGVSTTGDEQVNRAENRHSSVNSLKERVQKDEDDVEKDSVDEDENNTSVHEEEGNENLANENGGHTDNSDNAPSSPSKASDMSTPPPTPSTPVSEAPQLSAIPEDPSLQDSLDVVSSRKWCILDQSGSLFLHGAPDSAVSVSAADLRRVSSMSPAELVGMLTKGNEELDAAKAAHSVELRVVVAMGLDGTALQVEVFQRQDYLAQVTAVGTKNSPVEEADLLLSVDGRSLKNKRPAQVHSQLDSAGPKGVILTARGLKLPASAVKTDDSTKASSPAPPPSKPAPLSPSSPSGDAAATPAVSLGGGMYEVVMTKGATGVGFCLEGGMASPRGDLPILIKRIFKGGPAEKCGHLQVKDEILAVNDVDFTNMRHYEAWNHLKFLDDGEIRLKIRRPNED